jgi:adenine-specific DNA-methyltransferase
MQKLNEEVSEPVITEDGMIEHSSHADYIIKTDVTKNPQLDIGFRVFKLDTSNLKTWDSTPIADDDLPTLYDRMNGMINRVKTDRTDMDMVCEIMLKLGVPLTYSVTPVKINGKTAYSVGNDCLLLICLAGNVLPEDVEQMAEHAPAKIIIARDSFADDTAMANAYYILHDKGIELKLV